MNPLLILGSLGGVIAFLGALVVIARGIFRQINSVEENTKAINHLSDEVAKLAAMYNGHDTRIAVLEDWRHHASQR